MKHEKFKAFSDGIEADKFLADAKINAKSVSIIDNEKVYAIVIGYTDSDRTHHYKLETKYIDNLYFIGLEKAMILVEKLAKNHGGVICQDTNADDGTLVVTFLVATEK